MTLLEMVIAIAMLVIVSAALLPQFRVMLNSWDSTAAGAEVLQNGRVLIDHINHNLTEATLITAVSDSTTTLGYIEFEDDDGDVQRYDVDANSYVEFGSVEDLSELAGPVSQLQFTCYEDDDFIIPTTDGNDIRFVTVEATVTNSEAMGRDITFTAQVYIRTNSNYCTRGLVGWWKLNEDTGTTAADSSDSNNDGSLTNMVGDEWTTGIAGGALEFDGYDDYVNCGNTSSLQITGNLTIAAWAKLASGNSGNYYGITGKLTSGSNAGFALVRHSTDYFRFLLGDGSSIAGFDSDTTYTDTDWHHVLGLRGNGINYLYVDGTLQTATSTKAVSDSGGYAFIGKQYSDLSDRYFDGIIDDVRIYSRALSAATISQIATNLKYREFTEAKANSDTTSITLSTPGSGSGAVAYEEFTEAKASSGVQSITLSTPSGTSEDDLLIAAVVTDSSETISPPGGEGWTLVNMDDYDGRVTLGVWWKLADASESPTHQFTWGSSEECYAWMMRFTGHDSSDPINDSAATGGSSSSPTSPTVTTTVENCLILRLGGFDDDDITVDNTGLSGHTDITMDESSSGDYTCSGGAGYVQQAAIGSSGTSNFSLTNSEQYRTVTIAIAPLTGTGISEGDLLIAAVATDGDTSASLAPPGGEGWTEIDVEDYGAAVTLGAWWKNADASESASHEFIWSGSEQAYGWMMRFTGHNSTDPVDVWATYGESSSIPTSPAVTTTADGCLILRLGAFDEDNITEDDPGLSGHTAITMDKTTGSTQATYEEFTEAKASSNVTSITIPTPGLGGGGVTILGSWTSGFTHTAEAGSNRLLILTAHVEDNDADMTLNSVTYGGQAMTKVIERETQESSNRAYVVAYILDEAGIAAASGNTFSPSWSSTPDRVGYSSVFLSNVDQTTSIGASASNGSNSGSTISTSTLSTYNGDMVIVAGTAGNTGTYSVNNGFTEAIELSMSYSDGVAGYKLADGSDETPSITHSNPDRQVIIGFVVQVNEFSAPSIEGDLLIAAVATDGSETISAPGGEGWTLISHGSYSSYVTLGVWWKMAGASESSSHQFTWSSSEQCYGWMMRFTGHDPTTPINDSAATGGSSSSPTSPAVTTTVANCIILRIGGFDDDDITLDSTGLSGHTDITMDESTSGDYTCSGGAGYVQQAAIGSSGTSSFSLTNSEQYYTVTIAIAPAPAAGMVSGGAGYVKQSAAGDSGTSDFSLTALEQSRMLTIAISPDPDSGEDCGQIAP